MESWTYTTTPAEAQVGFFQGSTWDDAKMIESPPPFSAQSCQWPSRNPGPPPGLAPTRQDDDRMEQLHVKISGDIPKECLRDPTTDAGTRRAGGARYTGQDDDRMLDQLAESTRNRSWDGTRMI